MGRLTEKQVRREAHKRGVRFRVCSPWHWQLRSEYLTVNYWPSKNRVHINGTEHSVTAPRTARKLVAMATKPPARGKMVSRINMTQTRAELYKRSQVCKWCLSPVSLDNATVDHVIPLARGGTNRRDNLVLSCWECNQKRGSGMPEVTNAEARRKRQLFGKTLGG